MQQKLPASLLLGSQLPFFPFLPPSGTLDQEYSFFSLLMTAPHVPQPGGEVDHFNSPELCWSHSSYSITHAGQAVLVSVSLSVTLLCMWGVSLAFASSVSFLHVGSESLSFDF